MRKDRGNKNEEAATCPMVLTKWIGIDLSRLDTSFVCVDEENTMLCDWTCIKDIKLQLQKKLLPFPIFLYHMHWQFVWSAQIKENRALSFHRWHMTRTRPIKVKPLDAESFLVKFTMCRDFGHAWGLQLSCLWHLNKSCRNEPSPASFSWVSLSLEISRIKQHYVSSNLTLEEGAKMSTSCFIRLSSWVHSGLKP